MRRLLPALVAAGLLAPAAASGHGTGCHSRKCDLRVAIKQCSQTRVVPCIRRGALHHRVSLPMLMRKARCESGLNPFAINGSPNNRRPIKTSKATGLLQFMPGTWQTTPYRARWIFSAKWQGLAAAWMHKVGRGGEWECL